jgi:hypothetical protein
MNDNMMVMYDTHCTIILFLPERASDYSVVLYHFEIP